MRIGMVVRSPLSVVRSKKNYSPQDNAKAHGSPPWAWFLRQSTDYGLRTTDDGQSHATGCEVRQLLGLQGAALRLLGLPFVDLFHERVHHLALQDMADDFAALEDDALALAGGDPQVGLAGLA